MIEEIDQRLREWAGSIASDADISLSISAKADNGVSVSLYLMDILGMPAFGQGRRLPLQVRLRYLVSTVAESEAVAHELLGKLLFSAMEKPEFDVLLEPIEMSIWQAFGVNPRPAFHLSLPMRVERQEEASLIRTLPELVHKKIRNLDGILLGPGDIPVPNARIELADIKRSANTDENGRFHLSSIPETPLKRQFLISAKGQEFSIEANLTSETEQLILHFHAMEV